MILLTPQNPGDPDQTWPARRGAAWQRRHVDSRLDDPETHSYLAGRAIPRLLHARSGRRRQPVHVVAHRGTSIPARWRHYQTPHDTHDWDSTQTPSSSTPRSTAGRALVITARARIFLRPRPHHRRTFGDVEVRLVNNWASGLDEKGQPKRNRTRMPPLPARSSTAT